MLHGIDIDAAAVAACRHALPDADIRHGNALFGPDFRGGTKPPPPFRGPYMDWRGDYPEVFSRGGFDAVIGNPPWVSLTGRFAPTRFGRDAIAYLAERFGSSTYLPNLFESFVALSLELVRPGGYVGLLLPDRLAFNRQYVRLRERLVQETTLRSILFGAHFPGVTADTMLLVFRKGACSGRTSVEIGDWDGPTQQVPQRAIATNAERRFERPPASSVHSLMEAMRDRKRSVRLGEIVRIASGFGGRSECFTAQQVHRQQIPVLKGRSVRRYKVGQRFWFDFRRENLTGRTTDENKLGASPKILLRKTGDRLIATLDETGIFPDQSLYLLYGGAIDLRFLLGVLNSAPLTIYFRACGLTNPHSIAQVKKYDLELLPIPRLNLDRVSHRRRHDQMVRLVEQRLTGRGNAEELERAMDQIVCELFGLKETTLPCR